jgi:hypothetical protein
MQQPFTVHGFSATSEWILSFTDAPADSLPSHSLARVNEAASLLRQQTGLMCLSYIVLRTDWFAPYIHGEQPDIPHLFCLYKTGPDVLRDKTSLVEIAGWEERVQKLKKIMGIDPTTEMETHFMDPRMWS